MIRALDAMLRGLGQIVIDIVGGALALLSSAIEEHKLVRRLTLAWACWLISVVVLRVTDIQALPLVTGPVATVVGATIGILATVIGLYQWLRQQDDK